MAALDGLLSGPPSSGVVVADRLEDYLLATGKMYDQRKEELRQQQDLLGEWFVAVPAGGAHWSCQFLALCVRADDLHTPHPPSQTECIVHISVREESAADPVTA